jgi:hypothetical protein
MGKRRAQLSRADLLDTAFDVARRFEDFGSYGSTSRAERALARRCPGFSPSQYSNALLTARELWAMANRLVDANSDRLIAVAARTRDWNFPEFDGRLRKAFPAFRLSTLRGAISWSLFWHHLK